MDLVQMVLYLLSKIKNNKKSKKNPRPRPRPQQQQPDILMDIVRICSAMMTLNALKKL